MGFLWEDYGILWVIMGFVWEEYGISVISQLFLTNSEEILIKLHKITQIEDIMDTNLIPTQLLPFGIPT